MNTKVKRNGKTLWIILALLAVGGVVAAVLLTSHAPTEEQPLLTGKQTESAWETEETGKEITYPEKTEAEELDTYSLICRYIDQGDARAAVDALLEDQTPDTVYARLHMEDPDLLERILLEAACFYNEDGALYNLVNLRWRGFFTDEMFAEYWERTGTASPERMAADESYDAYLFHELRNWYERGDEIIEQIIDLRYLGMIGDDVYSALVAEWEMDLMDNVDPETYIPLYGMQLTEEEKDQIRTWRTCVDEGESRKAAEMILRGDITENVYCWLRKNNADMVDLVLAQAMFEIAADETYEQNMELILGGFVSDACFQRYWELLEFTPDGNERTVEVHPGEDMYFVYEIERICTLMQDSSLIQKLRDNHLIDDATYSLLLEYVGGREISDSEN